jgi:hypothetical protein
MNLYTFAVYNRALTDKEITDASAALAQVAPVVPSTVEIGNVNGRPALTVDPTGSVSVLGPLNGQAGGYAPTDLGINSLSLGHRKLDFINLRDVVQSLQLSGNICCRRWVPVLPGRCQHLYQLRHDGVSLFQIQISIRSVISWWRVG